MQSGYISLGNVQSQAQSNSKKLSFNFLIEF